MSSRISLRFSCYRYQALLFLMQVLLPAALSFQPNLFHNPQFSLGHHPSGKTTACGLRNYKENLCQPCSLLVSKIDDNNNVAKNDTTIFSSWRSVLTRSLLSALFAVHLAAAALSLAPPAVAVPPSFPTGQQYWTIMNHNADSDNDNDKTTSNAAKLMANTALMEYAVGTINSMYYDNTGGANFVPREFFSQWRHWLAVNGDLQLSTRQGVVDGLSWLTEQLHDPFSRYLTREQLKQELTTNYDGFLGLGAMVEPPLRGSFFGALRTPVLSEIPPSIATKARKYTFTLLSANQVSHLPILTAVAANSPAERAGLTVGDRIVAVQQDSFLAISSPELVQARLQTRYQAENYLGTIELTIAKPVYASSLASNGRSVIVAYRPQRIRLCAAATATTPPEKTGILQYQLLTASGPSPIIMMPQPKPFDGGSGDVADGNLWLDKVGYIRLTRFSKTSTNAFLQAVQDLEAQHAQAYILDLRNNYGGVIQESMLTASTLLRDPHAVLCYTLDSRGGFTPHQVSEFVVDSRYPGYLLSSESKLTTFNQVNRENPQFLNGKGSWSPPSSYASLAEQRKKLQIPPSNVAHFAESRGTTPEGGYPHAQHLSATWLRQWQAQKPIVLLVNEGTASSAEVFCAALHDNGRIVAVVGTKTYGKGLIQHTFPLPDGGGLRLTVAEYLTPSLRHVTHVGGAQYDPQTGEYVGGGITPDVLCDSAQGIAGDVGGDLCVGVGLDVLQEAQMERQEMLYARTSQNFNHHTIWAQHAVDGGSGWWMAAHRPGSHGP